MLADVGMTSLRLYVYIGELMQRCLYLGNKALERRQFVGVDARPSSPRVVSQISNMQIYIVPILGRYKYCHGQFSDIYETNRMDCIFVVF